MATNVNLGQSVWYADDIINPVTIVFCVVIYIFDKIQYAHVTCNIENGNRKYINKIQI